MALLQKISGAGTAVKSTKELKTLFRVLDEMLPVFELAADGTIMKANLKLASALGCTLAELVGQKLERFVEFSAAQPQAWQSLSGGDAISQKHYCHTKTGDVLWLKVHYLPVLDSQQQLKKVICLADNITEDQQKNIDYAGQLTAIGRSQAVIEFELDGTIITANENFCQAMGYQLEEIKGRHHRIFVDADYASSEEYQNFWPDLARGEFKLGEVRRITKAGTDIWIQATYNPIFDHQGKPFKVVKYATDVTAAKLHSADTAGQLAAISKSQAVIEFELDGTIINANENFCQTVGYSLDEIKGQHHRMFVEKDYAQSAQYKEFWRSLGAGKYDAGEYKRIGKSGQEIWIQASYNPIFDITGKPFKVVKYATDITAEKLCNADYTNQLDAIGKSQAVIEFNLDGSIITANKNFTDTVGYSLEEIQGKHHSIFVDPDYAKTQDYQALWQDLNEGKFHAGEFQRFGKGGKEIWIQASYNPIFDLNGKPFKVVKYASDVTDKKLAINAISKTLVELSQGRLDTKVTGEFSGEFGELAVTVNDTIARLAGLITRMQAVAEQVASGANEITNGNEALSARTEQQAASLEETSASMEQMTSSSSQSSTNAKQADEAVKQARQLALEGQDVVQSAVTAMGDISQASNKIADIIGTIDEIAFQTNLLALNAAVEAARAGDQGRGFAVVASEVRSLAQRSAASAKEISALIKDSQSKVEYGAQMTDQSGGTLENIVASVLKVSEFMGQIAQSSQEQSEGIQNVNNAIAQMDSMTQENAAMVEEVTATSKEMLDQINRLREEMRFFQTA